MEPILLPPTTNDPLTSEIVQNAKVHEDDPAREKRVAEKEPGKGLEISKERVIEAQEEAARLCSEHSCLKELQCKEDCQKGKTILRGRIGC